MEEVEKGEKWERERQNGDWRKKRRGESKREVGSRV